VVMKEKLNSASAIDRLLPTRSRDAEFAIRFDGLRFRFYCKLLDGYRRRIRKARALLIGGTVITAQPSQCWRLNKKRTHWTFCAGHHAGSLPKAAPLHVASILFQAAVWALSDSRNLIEVYQHGRVIRLKIVKTIKWCYLCDAPLEKRHRLYWYDYYGGVRRYVGECSHCREWWLREAKKFRAGETSMRDFEELTIRNEIDILASRDRSITLRRVRQLAAAGSFTDREFRQLSAQYGNVCLRCGRRRVLFPDHVIPLAKKGRNDITNIQPLCLRCNSIKGVRSSDYRLRRRPPRVA
jgi:hypothetical protein